eukprot:7651686-Karenia_brevis.AAC.1
MPAGRGPPKGTGGKGKDGAGGRGGKAPRTPVNPHGQWDNIHPPVPKAKGKGPVGPKAKWGHNK